MRKQTYFQTNDGHLNSLVRVEEGRVLCKRAESRLIEPAVRHIIYYYGKAIIDATCCFARSILETRENRGFRSFS